MSRTFKEKLTRFLRSELEGIRGRYGEGSRQYLALAHQYIRDSREDDSACENSLKHYEAGIAAASVEGEPLPRNMERLYRRSIVIEPTLVCLAHCRYCLRSNYEQHTMSETELVEAAKYCGSWPRRETVSEVLITGGDPLIIPNRVEILLNALIEYAPNVKIARIATRIPGQDPERIDEDVLNVFRGKPTLRFELATQINHPVEFFPETAEAFRRIRSLGVKIYSQNVLMKGVNDDLPTLIELYDLMRAHDIEAHYLFHCVPLLGTHHLRTTIEEGMKLARGLSSCGAISGRAKPMYAAMTDIGKIVFYEGSIVERKGNKVLLQSSYSRRDRLEFNPSWTVPESAVVDENGLLRVWYLDGGE